MSQYPISLFDLKHQLVRKDRSCMSRPFRGSRPCLRMMNISDEDLYETKEIIQSILRKKSLDSDIETFDDLKMIAWATSCIQPQSRKNHALHFTYHWIARDMLSGCLERMGWNLEPSS